MKELTLRAAADALSQAAAFVEEELEALGCPMKAQMQLSIAVDELLSNIIRYAYGPEGGPVTVGVSYDEDRRAVLLTFRDSGTPYNPLLAADPDVTLSAQERAIGGLGVFMVKKSMDDVVYEYRNGQNVLTVVKVIR